MAQLQLRPLGVGGIIDATITLYRRRFGPMMMIVLVLGVIPFALSLGRCTVDRSQMSDPVTCGNALGWVGLIAFSVVTFVAAFAAILVAASAYADLPADWMGATRAALRNIVPIVVASIVFYIVVGIGTLLLIVPGIILGISFGWYDAALMIERAGPMASLGRSWRLVAGERWRLFWAGLLMLIIATIVFGIIGVVVYLVIYGLFVVSDGYASYLAQQAVALLTIPLIAAFTTVVYLDLRVRKEGLDKEGLVAQLSGGS